MTHLALDLALLGFPITPDTILFHRPSSKLLEEILHFLFDLYDPQEAMNRLSECWPITSPFLAKRFRADVLRWSEDLKKLGALPRECVLRKSWLDESVGERLEEALARMAEFLVRREARRECMNGSLLRKEDLHELLSRGEGMTELSSPQEDDNKSPTQEKNNNELLARNGNMELSPEWYATEAFLPNSSWQRINSLYQEVEQLYQNTIIK